MSRARRVRVVRRSTAGRPRGLTAAVLTAVALAACGDPAGTDADDPGPFAAPMVGVLYEEIIYGALPDHVTAGGEIQDYACGFKTYDGHRGTDLVLPSFVEMDAGVPVLAAADGEVVHVVDGEPDRNLTRGFRPGNEVTIRHGDRLTSLYLHLRNGSITVAPGDRVRAGDVIGLVGSSGDSNWPHLHFEVHGSQGGAVDPWIGDCSPGVGLWLDQMQYPDRFHVIDFGTTDQPTTRAAIAERPPTIASFPADAPGLTLWLHIANRPAGLLRYELIGPAGGVADSASHHYDRPGMSTSLFGAWIALENTHATGDWSVRYSVDGETFATIPFMVTPATGAAAGSRAGDGADRAAWPRPSPVEPIGGPGGDA